MNQDSYYEGLYKVSLPLRNGIFNVYIFQNRMLGRCLLIPDDESNIKSFKTYSTLYRTSNLGNLYNINDLTQIGESIKYRDDQVEEPSSVDPVDKSEVINALEDIGIVIEDTAIITIKSSGDTAIAEVYPTNELHI